MNTEITDTKDLAGREWVCYDADCALCRTWAARLAGVLGRRGFLLVPLQSPAAAGRLRVSKTELLREVRVITRTGSVLGGADAMVHVARAVWWGWPLFALAQVPGLKPHLRRLYAVIARNRHCLGAGCRLPSARRTASGWDALPLVIFTAVALVFGCRLPAWGYMWTIAFALYAGCKWLSFRAGLRRGASGDRLRKAGYLCAWPGMDASAFLSKNRRVPRPRAVEWWSTAAKIILGTALTWGLARRVNGDLCAGWIAMIGLVLVLHFGVLHLVSIAWRAAGVDAVPLMRSPAWARSLSDFWGARWNTGFHQLAEEFGFRPWRERFGVRAATLMVFLVSGFIHELVITVPARGGYGLPTAYFVLQGVAVLFERSAVGRRLGLRRGARGRAFALVIAVGPVAWLFPPPFLWNVMLPFLKTLHAW